RAVDVATVRSPRHLRLGVCIALGGWSSLVAQEASRVGTVAGETKAVLPGATVTASEISTGQQFSAVRTEKGEYRLPTVPPGTYRIQAELTGFSTVVLERVELLVGQHATIPFTLKLAQVNETVTVAGESPLVDTASSQVSGNVDRRQMEELPL